MLPPENFYGMIEYKRYIIPSSKERFIQYETQLLWRIAEGKGYAKYYIGVDDDGTIHNINIKQYNLSIKNLKSLCRKNKINIISIKKYTLNNNYYYIAMLQKQYNKIKEKRILLLGDTNVGKTTLLAYIIKNKLGKNAAMFMHNHKHEIDTGKTSSFNYNMILFKNTRLIFVDSPGDNKYIKTRHKIISSIHFDLVLYIYKNNWDYETLYQKYFNLIKVPVIRINIYSLKNKFPKININKPINRNVLINHIYNKLSNNINNNTNMNVISSYYINDIGMILSCNINNINITINKDYYYYGKKNTIVKIKSIHINEEPINNISNVTCSVLMDKYYDIKYGFISNILYKPKTDIVIKILYSNGIDYNCYINNIYTKLNIIKKEKNILYCNNTIYYKQKYILGTNFIGYIE
jgi:GTPase